MNRSRKRKRSPIDHGSKNQPTPKRIKTAASCRSKRKRSRVVKKASSVLSIVGPLEIRIVLDKSIVERYLRAKQVIREIISSPNPRMLYPRSNNNRKSKKSSKLKGLSDYLQWKSIERPSDTTMCRKVTIKNDHQNTTLVLDVNMPRINSNFAYRAGDDNGQSNCFLLDGNNLMVKPAGDARQFATQDFIYDNYSFVPVTGAPIKTEFKEEPDDDTMNASFTIYDHAIADCPTIEDIATTSTPLSKPTLDERTIVKASSSDDEVKYAPVVKFDERGCPVCPKCERSFKVLEAFKHHRLLCGVEFSREGSYCTAYGTTHAGNTKKHVERMHASGVDREGLERISRDIKQKRMDKQTLPLVSREREIDSGVEESFAKREIKWTPSKLTFDLHCRRCEKSFKRINGIPMKTCPDCALTLGFTCQKCGKIFSTYSSVYHHVSKWCGRKGASDGRRSSTFKCDHCKFKTWHKAAIRAHIFHRHVKSDESAWLKCELCSYESAYKSNIKRHKRNAHGIDETIDLDERDANASLE